MTAPNSSTTVPNYVAGTQFDNTDLGHMINMLFSRTNGLEQRRRARELMSSRYATLHPSELHRAGRTGSSRKADGTTAPPATSDPHANFGPGWRRAPPGPLGTQDSERPDAGLAARGAASAYLAFGLPYPPPCPTTSFNRTTRRPRIGGDMTSTPSGNSTLGVTDGCGREMLSFEAYLKGRNVEPEGFLATPAGRGLFDPAGRGVTGAGGVAGPSQVVTTVTRTSERTLSASEVFEEVLECVIEYLGSDIEGDEGVDEEIARFGLI